MPTRPVTSAPARRSGRPILLVALLGCLMAPLAGAQLTFEQAIANLSSPDATLRLQMVRTLRKAGYPEAANPLVPLVTDLDDDVQLEAIGAELAIFIVEAGEPGRGSDLVSAVRGGLAGAEAVFLAGPRIVGPRIVPLALLSALRTAAGSPRTRVALEALYTLGVLGGQAAGAARLELRRASAADLSALAGASDPDVRLAALRVVGRLYTQWAWETDSDQTVGRAAIAALNEKSTKLRVAAMDALGLMRYRPSVGALTELHTHFDRSEPAEASLNALARIAEPTSAPLFTSALAGRNARFKVHAAEGLTRLGQRERLDDIRAAVRSERHQALALAGSFAEVVLGNGSIDALVDALARNDLHDQALRYLEEIAPGRVRLLARRAQDPTPHLRAHVADALGVSGDRTALPVVESLLRDTNPVVARSAMRARARLGTDAQ